MPRRIKRDLVWTSLCRLPVVLCSRALTAHKTPKMYVPEERSLFVGEYGGVGDTMLGHRCLCKKKSIKNTGCNILQ